MIKNIFILIAIVYVFTMTINFADALTTNQKALILNSQKTEVVRDIQEFVVLNGYKLQYADPTNGVFQIFVRETVDPGYVRAGQGMFVYNPPTTTNWYFSIKVLPQGNHVMVLGNSNGGLFPGRYFKKFVQYMQTQGYDVKIGDKAIKNNSISNASTQQTQLINNPPVSSIVPPIISAPYQSSPQQANPQFFPPQNYSQAQYQNPPVIGTPKNYSNNPADPGYRFYYNF